MPSAAWKGFNKWLLLPRSPVYTPLFSENYTTDREVGFRYFINILTFLKKQKKKIGAGVFFKGDNWFITSLI